MAGWSRMGRPASIPLSGEQAVQTPGPLGLNSLLAKVTGIQVLPPTGPQPLSPVPCLEALGEARVWSRTSLHSQSPTAALLGLGVGGVPTWHPWHPQTCSSFAPYMDTTLKGQS